MKSRNLLCLVAVMVGLGVLLSAKLSAVEATAKMEVVPGHPWRPPFGLDRVGRPPDVMVTFAGKQQPAGEFAVVGLRQGQEVSRQVLTPIKIKKDPSVARVSLELVPEEVVLLGKSTATNGFVELARQAVTMPPFEAEALAKPESVINPVDLGTILPPADCLLLAGGQQATVEIAALNRNADVSEARASVWYESTPGERVSASLPLKSGTRAQIVLVTGTGSRTEKKDSLHVTIADAAGKELWQKTIRVMRVPEPPKNPRFGAVTTKLRYDAPILSVVNGKNTFISYEDGWDPKLQDVVVFFPNGARWVFWRGASYCPFWASRFNTGMNYQWAERFPNDDGIGFCEPLFDHELRFGRVEIVESTAVRVHVRWTYQNSSFAYRPCDDLIVEDFFFYPDGFGTRTMTVTTHPGWKYQFEELIILSPQSAYPFEFMASDPVDVFTFQGEKTAVKFPLTSHTPGEVEAAFTQWPKNGTDPVWCRIRMNRQDSLAAFTFSIANPGKPQWFFAPFYDHGTMVTPCYWGPHWPLTRGLDTGWTISDRIALTPGANSLLGWNGRPETKPLKKTTIEANCPDGKKRRMDLETYVWLIGMSDEDDAHLLRRAKSFPQPPTLELAGAKAETELYAPERRALRLIVEQPIVTVLLKPVEHCVNPVFELSSAPKTLKSVSVDEKPLDPARYAWDGKTIWLDATFSQPSRIRFEFADVNP